MQSIYFGKDYFCLTTPAVTQALLKLSIDTVMI